MKEYTIFILFLTSGECKHQTILSRSTHSYRIPIVVTPQIASLNHVIFCFVSQRETPIITMVFTWLPFSSLSQTLFLLTHSVQWHWPSVSSWNAIRSTFCSFLFENFCTLLPSVWNLFPCLFCSIMSWLDNCIFQVLLSMTISFKIETSPTSSFTIHSLVISILSFRVYRSVRHVSST